MPTLAAKDGVLMLEKKGFFSTDELSKKPGGELYPFLYPNCLSHLLPYDLRERTGAKLRASLKEYRMLLNATLSAIKSFESFNLDQFDALVGENACQIRAIRIASLAANSNHCMRQLRESALGHIEKMDILLQDKVLSKLMNKGLSFYDYLISEQLSLKVNQNDLFIILSYLLQKTKKVDYNNKQMSSICLKEKCHPKMLKSFGDISSSFADNLVSQLRKTSSILSVKYVQEESKYHSDQCTSKMVSNQYTFLHNGHLHCTPMFWTYKTLLNSAKRENIKIILHAKFLVTDEDECMYTVIDHDYLAFMFNNATKGWENIPISEYKTQKTAACVIQGIVRINNANSNVDEAKKAWRNNIFSHELDTVILAGAADHRQYPCSLQDENLRQQKIDEVEKYQELAKEYGFSLENPSCFFIQHVFSDNTINFLEGLHGS